MVVTELFLKIPYSIAWRLVNNSSNPFPVVFYCTDYLDYLVFEPVMRYLPEMTIVSKNRRVQDQLFKKGISSILYPAYPEVVIMARHSLHMFPSKNIIKIGMRHGVYHFKNFIDAAKYNRFDLFLFTSENELEKARKLGIENGVAVGFPKIDDLYGDNITENLIGEIKQRIEFDAEKKTILFTSTWNKSGLSSLHLWYNKVKSLSSKYNILVTVHPFTDKKLLDNFINSPGFYFIKDENLNPYLLMADLLIGDTSSIIGEFCSLDKPIITFTVDIRERMNPEISDFLEVISFRVSSFEELTQTIPKALENPGYHSEFRKKFNSMIYTNLDGNAGKKAAETIKDLLEERGISF